MTSGKGEPHPLKCEMWAMVDPDGNIMNETVVLEKKRCIYNGTVWGRCGDDRTWKDFQKEGYRVVKVNVIPHSSATSEQRIADAITVLEGLAGACYKDIPGMEKRDAYLKAISLLKGDGK